MHVEEGEGLALRLCVQAKNKPRNPGLPRLRDAAVIARARAEFVISAAYIVCGRFPPRKAWSAQGHVNNLVLIFTNYSS